jgi:prepilin-type processing-associated H-X9-DG protein
MHLHHENLHTFPPGATNNPRHTWVVHLWPYIEQGNLATQYGDPNNPFWTPPRINQNAFTGLCAVRVNLYYCPSDRVGAYDTHDTYYRCRGNYAVNWGTKTIPYTGKPPDAPFGYVNNNTGNPQKTRLTDIKDGTANTLLLSERILAVNDNDQNSNGDFLNDDPKQPGTEFMTIHTPNSGIDVIFCNTNNDPRAPCTNGVNLHATARSRHAGGVNVAFCDGSTRFITDTIPLGVWQTLGSMNGGEPNTEY